MAADDWYRSVSTPAGDRPVKAWTPDPTKYHAADATQESRLGSATMIPRANSDGTSKGFNATRASVLIIDPDKPGGGIAIDPAMMSNAATRDALNRVGRVGGGRDDVDSQNNAFAAYQIIGSRGAATIPERAVVAYEAMHPVAEAPRSVARSAPVPALPTTQYTYPEPVMPVPNPTPHGVDGVPSERVVQLSQSQLDALLKMAAGAQQAPTPHPQLAARAPIQTQPLSEPTAEQYEEPTDSGYGAPLQEPEYPLMQSQPQPQARQPVAPPARRRQPQSPAVDPFASLQTGFLFATPQKPSQVVVFDMGKAGGVYRARYHAVVEGAGCLVLVYDTRYEDGVQWMPPHRKSDPMKVHVPTLNNKKYRAMSLGMSADVGALNLTILVVDQEDQPSEQGMGEAAAAIDEQFERPFVADTKPLRGHEDDDTY